MFNAPLDHFGVDDGKHGAVFLEFVVFWGKAALLLGKRKGLGDIRKGRSGEMSWRTDRREVTVLEMGVMDSWESSKESWRAQSFGGFWLNKEVFG